MSVNKNIYIFKKKSQFIQSFKNNESFNLNLTVA